MDFGFLPNTDILKFVDFSGFIPAVLIIIVTMIIGRFVARFFERLGERFTTRRLLFKQLSVLSRFLLLFIAGYFCIDAVFDLNTESFSFIGGILLFGLSFSLKDLVASLMSGILLLFDKPFQVGDRISFQGSYGEVVEIGLRTVRIVDLNDNLISIPNNQFLSATVSSANAGNLDQMCVFEFYIGCGEDFVLAERLIREVLSASRFLFWPKPVKVLMAEIPLANGIARFAIRLTAKAYVSDGRYEEEFLSDVHSRVKQAFRRNGIRSAGDQSLIDRDEI